MYVGAISEMLSYAAGSATADAIRRTIDPGEPDASAGVVERAAELEKRQGRIGFVVSGLLAFVLAVALFRRRRL